MSRLARQLLSCSHMWSVVQASAAAQPTPVVALAVSGMNNVLNSQGYAQATFWTRIPIAACGLMGAIAICSNLLTGYHAQPSDAKPHSFSLYR